MVARPRAGGSASGIEPQPAGAHDLADGTDRPLDHRGVDVEVRHGADACRAHFGHAHAFREQRRGERGRRHAGDVEIDEVRFDLGRIDREAGDAGEPFGEAARVRVIVGEAIDADDRARIRTRPR